MQYYRTDDNRSGRNAATVATIIYALLFVVLMLAVKFHIEPESEPKGIIMDFGDGDYGMGIEDTVLADADAPAVPYTPALQEEQFVTQDFEEAPAVRETPPEPDRRVRDPQPQQTPVTETPPEEPRQVNPRALFSGSTAGSTSSSEGTAGGSGNQGSQDGQVGGSHNGGGTGDSGTAELTGRRLVGALPLPAYNANEEGRVVVSITVNGEGKVVSAVYRSQGSTTQNIQLVNAAIAAARKATFSVSEAVELQQGTITYVFKLK